MKYLVTGANGYMGSHVVKELLDHGHEVYAADVRYDSVDERAVCLQENIFSGEEDIFQKLKEPDICIHLAWRNGFVHNADSHILELPSHYLFVKNMIAGGCKHLVVMGSMHEIGYWEGAIDENTPANPKSLYGVAKNSLRQLSLEMAEKAGICLQWLRGFYILGDDLKNNSIFSKIIKADMEGKKTFPFTSGKNLYDFIKVSELAKQIVSVTEQTEVSGIINCCTGKPHSLAEEVESFIKEHNLQISLEYGAYPDRPYDSPGIWGDPTKINKILQKNEEE
ncbi:MAG: NAD(P)-dependent oxidoreductase [Lachnospiraceae bacterium]|nr:NAD(P)-dependent oxidoreductase [Lachnospiraceae bacterium]